ncbi:MAG TPA: hypothetical protein VIQ53_10580 [Inquilinus sp.]|uniref:hypothetical protein n=1 Tax=Inquilinus sp. TaxID=1932117 RepID=UPI002FAC78A9
MAIKPGSLNSFANSMAAEIEAQLNALLTDDGLPALPIDGSQETRDRRRLFVAIARGVVKHLEDHHADIQVPYVDDGVPKSTSANLNVTWV